MRVLFNAYQQVIKIIIAILPTDWVWRSFYPKLKDSASSDAINLIYENTNHKSNTKPFPSRSGSTV